MTADETPPTEAMLDGRYRLGECVGEGGMARVYRAEDLILGRTVAIKMLRPTVDSTTTPERARSETTVLASLNHPSLVTLFDARLIPGQPEYMVMEFVDGPTLSERLTQGAMPADELAHVAADLAEALHVVHSAGVVHRDIKPSNVLLSPSHLPGGRCRAKLADFGIAWLLDTARMTAPGVVIGTAAYLAPEQVRGAQPSPPADIYSLGLVLLEALTGARAYPQAEGFGTALARLSSPPVIPASVGPSWSHLLTRMTSTEPELRPSAAEVALAASELASAAGALPGAGAVPGALSASAAAATAPTSALAAPTAATASPLQDATSTRPLPVVPTGVERATPDAASRRRRRSMVGGLITAAAAVAIAVGVWAAGIAGAPQPDPPVTPVTERSVAPDPSPSAPTVDDSAVPGDTAVQPVDDGNSETKDSKEQQKAAEKAEKEAEKAAEKARKDAEKAQKEAEKAAEEQEEVEEQPTVEPTVDPTTEATTEPIDGEG